MADALMYYFLRIFVDGCMLYIYINLFSQVYLGIYNNWTSFSSIFSNTLIEGTRDNKTSFPLLTVCVFSLPRARIYTMSRFELGRDCCEYVCARWSTCVSRKRFFSCQVFADLSARDNGEKRWDLWYTTSLRYEGRNNGHVASFEKHYTVTLSSD